MKTDHEEQPDAPAVDLAKVRRLLAGASTAILTALAIIDRGGDAYKDL